MYMVTSVCVGRDARSQFTRWRLERPELLCSSQAGLKGADRSLSPHIWCSCVWAGLEI